jgi:hypothetical protein
MTKKFKIGDDVKISGFPPRYKGQIYNCWWNESENINLEDGEIVYVIEHVNTKSRMVQTNRVKESRISLAS